MLYEFVHPRKRLEDVPFYDLLPSNTLELDETHLHEFFNFMTERQNIWIKRNLLKMPQPWTKDEFLKNYSFTNVYRELDRSSQYLIKNVISNPKYSLEDIVFQILVYRYFNKPDCFEDGHVQLTTLRGFNAAKMHWEVIKCRKKYYNPWHSAYMSNLVWAEKEPFEGEMFKDHAYCRQLFPIFKAITPELCQMLKKGKQPVEIMKFLERLPSISGFISHEFYLDFCYINKYHPYYKVNFDENTYTNVGPGASLGIRLICPSLAPKDQKEAIYMLSEIAEVMLPDFNYVRWDDINKKYEVCAYNLTLHSIEFSLCEYSKYVKMKWGKGKQRSKFIPHELS